MIGPECRCCDLPGDRALLIIITVLVGCPTCESLSTLSIAFSVSVQEVLVQFTCVCVSLEILLSTWCTIVISPVRQHLSRRAACGRSLSIYVLVWGERGGLWDCYGVPRGLAALPVDNQGLIGGSVVHKLRHSSLTASCMRTWKKKDPDWATVQNKICIRLSKSNKATL